MSLKTLVLLPSGFVCNTEVATYSSVHPHVLIKAELLLITGAIVSDLKPITSIINSIVSDNTAVALLLLFFLAAK